MSVQLSVVQISSKNAGERGRQWVGEGSCVASLTKRTGDLPRKAKGGKKRKREERANVWVSGD